MGDQISLYLTNDEIPVLSTVVLSKDKTINGIRLGMNRDEVVKVLGAPYHYFNSPEGYMGYDFAYYINPSIAIFYDKHKTVNAISVSYIGRLQVSGKKEVVDASVPVTGKQLDNLLGENVNIKGYFSSAPSTGIAIPDRSHKLYRYICSYNDLGVKVEVVCDFDNQAAKIPYLYLNSIVAIK
jgi:hypothetical protein